MITTELPYPPSVNRYYRHVGKMTLISAEGRKYRQLVCSKLAGVVSRLSGRVTVTMEVYPPDRRVRDMDNLFKAFFDSLTHAGAWTDDSRVRELHIIFHEDPVDGGLVWMNAHSHPSIWSKWMKLCKDYLMI